MKSLLFVRMITAILVALFFVSCQPYLERPQLSQVPVTTNYPLSTQKKMQALEHWKLLAKDTARQIKMRIEDSQYPNAGLYVTPSGTTAFEKNFRSLLISALVEEQVRVTNQQGNHLLLSFELDMLKHNKRMMVTESGRYPALGPDLVLRPEPACFPECFRESEYYPRMDVEAGQFTREMPRSEIVITTSLIYNSNYLYRDSSIYYIDDKEWSHYKEEDRYKTSNVKEYYVVSE